MTCLARRTDPRLCSLAEEAVAHARRCGATASAAEASAASGLTVSVRNGAVETLEYNRDKGLGVTVYVGRRRGHASTSDFSRQAMRQTVEAALAIARHTAEDDCAGLPEPAQLATTCPDLDLDHPWDITVEQAIALAQECEQAAFDADRRIVNSEGASVNVHRSEFVLANSLGFVGGYASTRHSVGCVVIAGGQDTMQRDYWYSTARHPADILRVQEIGRLAAERTVRRLAARQPPTLKCPVLFEAPVAATLFGHFAAAASGGNLYRGNSFLQGQLGQPVFSALVHVSDDPSLPRGLASSPFDEEGVRTQRREIVQGGVLGGYFLGSYSARKLNMQTTGNAGGTHNLIVRPGGEDFAGLLRQMGRGLVVTELLGHGVNPVTGDYSRGAVGFWVEHGEIQYPVEEFTIADNLKAMYRNIIAIGNDVQVHGSRQCGSVLVERMSVAGK
ncbi:MAG: metalloprotease PmbA [Sideroxydans sp.]